MRTLEKVEATPLVVDGVMYVTRPPNDVFALDVETGRPFWSYVRSLPEKINVCCGQVNRGLAMLGNRLYIGTVDAHLVALDAKTGAVIWDVEVADRTKGYGVTVAPLAVKDKIIVGMAGGEYGARGFLDAYDAVTGKRVWRFYTVPAPGEPGSETWKGDTWKTGGGPTWVTGSLIHRIEPGVLGNGQPVAGWNGDVRRRRQPVYGERGGAVARHRKAEVAFSIHSARCARLRRRADPGAGGRRIPGHQREAYVLGQSQYFFLRP